MKTIFVILFLLSCNKEATITGCDEVTFVTDIYFDNPNGYMYQKTDTTFKNVTYCDSQLDSLLNIDPYDIISADTMRHYRFVFKNHNF